MAKLIGQPDVVRVEGLPFHVRRDGPWEGNAPTLVMANSLGTDCRVWDPLLAHMPSHYRVLRYDKRGHGLSAITPPPYTMDRLVDDLATVMDMEGVKDAVIVGLSIGGMIAQGLAAVRPGLVRALVLMDTAHKIGTPAIWDERIATVLEGGTEAVADAVMARWFTPDYHTHKAYELALWRAMLVRTPAAGYIGCSQAIREADFTETTAELKVPTLCIVGDQDGSTPVDVVRSMADLIPGARLEVVANAGHLPGVEQPAAVAALLSDFFHQLGHG